MPSFLWVQTFQFDFGNGGLRSWSLGLRLPSELMQSHRLNCSNVF